MTDVAPECLPDRRHPQHPQHPFTHENDAPPPDLIQPATTAGPAPLADEKVEETPLPKMQLFILLYLQLAEPITSTVIYPFVNQLVRETGVTGGDERKTGYFAGLIVRLAVFAYRASEQWTSTLTESCFYAVEAICVLQWGRASDRIGRKPVLLGGLLGLTLSMIGFGVSKQYWALVLSRCAEGALNGNIGVTKSMMAEITDHTNRARGFAFLPMIWAVGGTLGPVIGGVFARPADRWSVFRKSTFWTTYRYFLPCVIAACISISAFIFALVGLKETLPSVTRHQAGTTSLPTKDVEKLPVGPDPSQPFQGGVVEEARSSPPQTPPSDPLKDTKETATASVIPAVTPTEDEAGPVSLRTILIPRVLYPILNYGFVALIDQAATVLVPLMYSTSLDLGGLGFDPFTIGLVQGVGGFAGGVTQIFTFPYLHRRFGTKRLYVCAYVMYFVIFASFPLNSFVTRRAGRVGAATWVLIVMQWTAYVVSYMSWGCIFLYISDGAPSQKALGLTNGLAQTTASTVRAIAPVSGVLTLLSESGTSSG
ncbi:hypothetical protein ONZ51_g991 [Trametes cubensis]|uniref:Major facilitator superfamily (MFS) profile domain-containing protein n=1 Tax=Trametes cubensis TaxID=1111947 RepID=A0AAD7U2B9_9APHY|nr:hypothetical protein ONZ51_g991 [Trametes cubensis]